MKLERGRRGSEKNTEERKKEMKGSERGREGEWKSLRKKGHTFSGKGR